MKSPRFELTHYRDPSTQVPVTRWTASTSNHLYFTNPGWLPDGRRMVFTRDVDQGHELWILDLKDGGQQALLSSAHPFMSCVHPLRNLAYTWVDRDLVEVDADSGSRRVIHQVSPGFEGVIPNVSADGRYICFGESEARQNRSFEEMFAAHPRCRILAHDLEEGRTRLLHERDCWMGHVNTSPSDPSLLSFCHEGPWTQVENRVWGYDLHAGDHWKIRPMPGPPACIGHEYWLADQAVIAYHGFNSEATPVLGMVDARSNEVIEHAQPFKTKHSHSLDGRIIVGDGSEACPWILVWRFREDALEGPWKLCRHGGGWSEQRLHVHPRISPDGTQVWFTSDVEGVPCIYSAELPDSIESLPLATELG